MRRAVVVLLAIAALAVGAVAYAVIDGRQARDATEPMAKTVGFHPPEVGLDGDVPTVSLAIAFDPQAAQAAWDEHVPDDADEASSPSSGPGVYAELGEVDFDDQVLAVWYSTESSGCPEWLDGVSTGPLWGVRVHVEDDRNACLDDIVIYSMLVAVEREQLPSPEDLPTDHVTGAGGTVTSYPIDDV